MQPAFEIPPLKPTGACADALPYVSAINADQNQNHAETKSPFGRTSSAKSAVSAGSSTTVQPSLSSFSSVVKAASIERHMVKDPAIERQVRFTIVHQNHTAFANPTKCPSM